jgi:hypothetical protein
MSAMERSEMNAIRPLLWPEAHMNGSFRAGKPAIPGWLAEAPFRTLCAPHLTPALQPQAQFRTVLYGSRLQKSAKVRKRGR